MNELTPSTTDQVGYRPAQAAAKLGVGNTTLWKWIKEGKLPVRRIGRVTLIPSSAITRLLDAA